MATTSTALYYKNRFCYHIDVKKFPVSKTIRDFASVFKENGFELYVVGGAVRDYLLGLENHDYDFCTDALPEQVIKIFKKTIPTGLEHGTVTVLFKGNSFEVTTYRTESDYTDSRHPDSVKYVRNLAEDLSRRDFTVNAFAANCNDGKITDLFEGEKDLKNKIIKAIGNPEERFSEDALRMMRMCRFAAKLNFTVDDKTKNAANVLSKTINRISKERICDEIMKTLSSEHPATGLRLMEETGILKEILPELEICRQIKQDKVNAKDVLEHTYRCLEAASCLNYSLDVRLALLLHDIGKYKTKITDNNNTVHFPNHDIESSNEAVKVLKRLKCSNRIIEKSKILIANHMVKYNSTWTDGAVKRFINRVEKDNINELFELQWCDQIASEGKSKADEYDEFIQRIKKVQNEPLTIKDLAINGNDLMQLNIKHGPEIGKILNQLLEMVLDDSSLNIREKLIEQSLILYNNNLRNGQ